jgi:branched-chain amino acid transport system substrate-binding protein
MIVAAVGLIPVVGCGDDGDKSGDAAASKEPIVIGHAAGLSGFMRQFDYPALVGEQAAIEDINKKGGVLGRRLKLISADSKSDKVQAGTAAAKLLDQGAQFIIAPCDFDFGAAAAIEAQKKDIVGMSPCAGTVQFGVQAIGPYAYTMGNSGAGYGIAMAEWAHDQGYRSVYILQDDTLEYHKQGCRAFAARWEMLDGTSIALYDHFQGADASVASQVTRLKKLSPQPDFIMQCSVIPPALTSLRQFLSSGTNLPILASGQTFDGEFWQKSVPGVSNLFYPTFGLLDGKDPRREVNDLVARLEPKLKELISPQVIAGYSVIQAYALAAERAGSLDGPAIKAELDKFKDEDLLIGPTTFTPDLHISLQREVGIMEFQDGERSLLEMWTPHEIPPMEKWVTE